MRDNPSLQKPITALIAGHLFEKLYEHRGHGHWTRKAGPFAAELRADSGVTANWVRRFAGHARSHLTNRGNPNRLTVVNFNYDRIFETMLREVWEQTERKYAPFENCFELLYPYGVFESLANEVQDAGEFLIKQRDRISLAGSAPGNGELIQERVLNADRIYLCGLSCAESAVDLLALDRTDASIYAQNYGKKDRHLDRMLRGRLGVPDDHIDAGSMIDLVGNGFFDQGLHDPAPLPQGRESGSRQPRRRKSF